MQPVVQWAAKFRDTLPLVATGPFADVGDIVCTGNCNFWFSPFLGAVNPALGT